MQQYPVMDQTRIYLPKYQNQYGQYIQQPQSIPNNPYANPPQMQSTPPCLKGRTVSDDSDIRPNDVPTDGSPAFFPRTDGQAIYVKWWESNGLIKGVTFIPSQETTADKTVDADTIKKLDDILERLARLEKRLGKPYNPNRSNNGQQNVAAKKEDMEHD